MPLTGGPHRPGAEGGPRRWELTGHSRDQTGRQLREWRRTTDKGNPDAAVFDLLAEIADPVVRKVPRPSVPSWMSGRSSTGEQ